MSFYTRFIFKETEAQDSLSLLSEVALQINWIVTNECCVNTCPEKDHSVASRGSLATVTMSTNDIMASRRNSLHQESYLAKKRETMILALTFRPTCVILSNSFNKYLIGTDNLYRDENYPSPDIGGNGEIWSLRGRPGFPRYWQGH